MKVTVHFIIEFIRSGNGFELIIWQSNFKMK